MSNSEPLAHVKADADLTENCRCGIHLPATRFVAGEPILHPVAPAINADNLGVMQQAVKQRRRQHVIASNTSPIPRNSGCSSRHRPRS